MPLLELDALLYFLRQHPKLGGTGWDPAVRSDWAGTARPALYTVSGCDVHFGLKTELRVQGPVAPRHRPVRNVDHDLLEAPECLPRVLVAELEKLS